MEMSRDEIATEACFQFVKIMEDMTLNMAMSMLATCITDYAEHNGYDVYCILMSIVNAYKIRIEGGGTDGTYNSSNSV